MKMISERRQREIIDLYSQGNGLNVVADLVGCSSTGVRAAVIRAGILRGMKEAGRLKALKNPLTWGSMTPARAWFLGVVFGDGGFSRNGSCMTITVSNKDIDILAKIQSSLNYKGTISQRTGCVQLGIHGSRFTQQIASDFALNSDKCKEMRWPILPKRAYRHFVRGLLDSDGSWHARGGRQKDLLVCSYSSISQEFVEAMEQELRKQLGVCRRTVRKQTRPTSVIDGRTVNRSPIYALEYGHVDAVMIGHWIYKGKTQNIRGDRKFEIWEAGTNRNIPAWCKLRHHNWQIKTRVIDH